MNLTGLETVLLGCGVAAVSSVAGGIIVKTVAIREAVTKTDCDIKHSTTEAKVLKIEMDRKEAWKNHHEYCPDNRELLTKTQHDKDCVRNLKPMQEDIKEIKTMLTTINDRLISAALK
jgi:hypothetical protein